jgi:hypothetical protein
MSAAEVFAWNRPDFLIVLRIYLVQCDGAPKTGLSQPHSLKLVLSPNRAKMLLHGAATPDCEERQRNRHRDDDSNKRHAARRT